MDICGSIKTQLSFVASSRREVQKAQERLERSGEVFIMPDGTEFKLNDQLVSVPESLFSCEGLHNTLDQTIHNCDIDIRKDLYSNIVLSGGGSLLTNLQDRLDAEMRSLAPETMRIKIIAAPERQHSAWIGGSILGSLAYNDESAPWITQDEYSEVGPSIVHRKFF